MGVRSCVPPTRPEPLSPPGAADAAREEAAARDAARVSRPEGLVSRLVYDSLVPPERPAAPPAGDYGAAEAGSAAGSGGGGGDGGAAACGGPSGRAYTPGLEPWYAPESPDDTTLVFESRFECGNLRRVVRPYEYDLVLQPDINTRGHTQWFYFAVSNTRAGRSYRFNLVNLLKDDSLYGAGMLPLVHSEARLTEEGVGWVRGGSGVCYYRNGLRRRGGGTYATLSFSLTLPRSWDVVHVAHCYPYSYTDLQRGLAVLHAAAAAPRPPGAPPAPLLERRVLCSSLAGNAVDLLTITAAAGDGAAAPVEQRRGVVLSARVHPGETNASWMMKGALEFLLGPSREAAALRGAFVFKARGGGGGGRVVPMLNPDGVVVGNYRCGLAGLDLNREYREPGPPAPPVAALKAMAREFSREREVVLLCDLHGHSRKLGVFAYGCDRGPKDAAPAATGWPVPGSLGGLPGAPAAAGARLFPLMLALNAPDLFCYKSCNFAVQKSKAGTGRAVAFREMGLANALTLEASFAGPAGGRGAGRHFNAGHLEEMGAALVRTLCDYWAPDDRSSAWELARVLEMTSPASGRPAAHLVQVGARGGEGGAGGGGLGGWKASFGGNSHA
ncbi:MAG: hypothetical protein J3K34DRAFT_368919 [Monoraphidium minutum]|nr:MAG: hypothetical protein J3K34DRAFT_368919 [Monoraphidium minutum]